MLFQRVESICCPIERDTGFIRLRIRTVEAFYCFAVSTRYLNQNNKLAHSQVYVLSVLLLVTVCAILWHNDLDRYNQARKRVDIITSLCLLFVRSMPQEYVFALWVCVNAKLFDINGLFFRI